MSAERLLPAEICHSPALLIAHDGTDDPALHRIIATGVLDAFSAGHLFQTVIAVLHRQRLACIDLNLRGLTFLDSTGIGTLLLCRAYAERVACRLTLSDPRPSGGSGT